MKNNSHSRGFDARRQNKYSIRRFTVGTASIIVGATLLFGVGNEARAAEADTDTNSTQDAKNTNGQPVDSDPVEADTNTNEAPEIETDAPSEDVKEDAPKAEETPSEDVKEDAPKAEETPSEDVKEDAPKAEETPAEDVKEDTSKAEETPSEDVKEDTSKAEETLSEDVKEDAPKAEETPSEDVKEDTSKAEDTLAENAKEDAPNVEEAPAQKVEENASANATIEVGQNDGQSLSNLDGNNLSDEELAAALKQSSDNKDASTVEAPVSPISASRATAFSAENDEPTISTFAALEAGGSEQALKDALEADAIYSPGEWMQRYGYQGNAVIVRNGSKYNNTSNQEPLEGVNVYLQWTDRSGFVSPVYYTTSGEDGRFVIDLSEPVKDALGREHTFNLAADSQIAVRTWAESPDPTLDVVKDGDSIRGFHKRLERVNESWDFTAGINRIVGSQVILSEKPLQNDWLIKPEADWETSGTDDGIWENQGNYGTVRGSVWYDLAEGYGSDARWLKHDRWDANATGVKVAASYVNDDVAVLFDEWKKDNSGYTMEQFRDAQAQIVTDYQAEHGEGSHIAETVVGTVDSNGNYYIPFRGLYGISPYQQNNGSKTITDEEYGTLVRDGDISHGNLMAWNGTMGQKHRHINSDYMYITPLVDGVSIWSNNYHNNMFTSADVNRDLGDAKMLSSYNGSSQDFAFIATNPMHQVSIEDSTETVAHPGDTLVSKTEGLFPGEDYKIQWFKDGVAIGDPVTVTAEADGTVQSVPLTIEDDLSSTSVYTSGVFASNASTSDTTNALALDYILAEPFDQADLNEPNYEAGKGLPGDTVDISAPSFEDKDGNEVTVPEGTTFEAGEDAPEGVTVNPDGTLSVEVPEDAEPGSTISVPVNVTYPDGSVDTVNVPVTVQPPAPEVNEIEAGSDEVTGTGYPGGTVEVTFPDGTTETTTVNPDGTWSIPSSTPLKADEVVKATQTVGTDANGEPNVSAEEETTVQDTTVPEVAPIEDVTVPEDQAITPIPVEVTDASNTTVEVTGLPEGVEYNEETGQIEGTPTTPGEYDVTVTVTDEAGNKAEETFTITVTDETAPEIAPIEDVTVPEDQAITPIPVEVTDDSETTVEVTGLPEGVEYNEETGQIEGTPTTPGEYDVTVTVTDEAGNKTEETFTITVTDETAPDAPVINNVGDGDKEVSGTGEPNGTVTVTFPDGTTVETPVDADGNWTAEVPEGTELHAGDEITAVETDEAGNTSEPSTTIVQDETAPDAPVINNVGDSDKEVSGTGEPNGTVTVTFPDGTTVETPVDADGNWTAEVPEGTELHAGDEITAVETDEAGNVSEPSTTIVEDTTAPDAPTIDQAKDTDKEVSGTGEPNGTVTVTFPDGTTVETPVDADGNWTAEVPEGTELHAGDEITAVETDESGNTSEPSTTIVQDTTAPEIAPIEDVTVPEDQAITPIPVEVTDDSETTVEVTGLPEGVEYNEETGQIEGTPTTPGVYEVTVTVTDEAGNTAEETFTITVTDETAPDAPVINNVGEGDKEVSGTGEPNGTVTVTFPDGTTVETPVDADGNWTAEVPEGTELHAGDEITAVETDESGNTSEPSTTIVQDTTAPDAPVINNVGEGDKEVSGTGEPNGTVTVTFPDGTTVETPVDADGNWTAEVPEGTELHAGDKITVVETDESGNTSEPSTTIVQDTTALDAPVVNPVEEGDKVVTGTGEAGSKVTVTFPDGEEVSTTVDEDGNWVVTIPEGTTVKEGDTITAVQTDKAGNVSDKTTITVVGKDSEAPSVDNGSTDNSGANNGGTDNSGADNVGTNNSDANNGDTNNGGTDNSGVNNGGTTNNGATASNGTSTSAGNADEAPTATTQDQATQTEKSKEDQGEELPDTGETTNNATLFGGLFAALGSILLFRKRRQNKEEK